MTTTMSVKPSNQGYPHQRASFEETRSLDLSHELATDRRSPGRGGDFHGRVSSAAVKNGTSPYLQKLAHSSFIQVVMPSVGGNGDQHRRRRNSRRRSTSIVRTCVNLEEIDNQVSTADSLDLALFFGQTSRVSQRPSSAPNQTRNVVKKKRKIRRKSTQRLLLQSQNTMITIYRNGDHTRSCRCRITTLNALFSYATEKLQMPSAARRLFDNNGREIYRIDDVQANEEYYVSSGENFKDPYRPLQTQAEYGANSKWTMRGIQTDAVKPDSFKTRTAVSERLDKQIYRCTTLTIIQNGFGKDSAVNYIIIDAARKQNFEKFLEDATVKLGMTAHARRAFDYRGEEIKSVKRFFKSATFTMQHLTKGIIYGPLWISVGERFRPNGAYAYLQCRYQEYVSHLQKLKKAHSEVLKVMEDKMKKKQKGKRSDEDSDDSSNEDSKKRKNAISNKALLSMKRNEIMEHREKLEKEIEETKRQIELYQNRMSEIEADKKEEDELLARYSSEHIKEIKFEDRIVGRHPLKLIVHENGVMRPSDRTIILDLRSLPGKNIAQTPVEYLLNYLQNISEVFARQRPKRVFDLFGNEIRLIGQLKNLQHIFVSFGEDYRPAFQPCLAIEIHSIDVYERESSLWLVKTVRPEDEMTTEQEKRSGKQTASQWKPVHHVPDDVRKINYDDLSNDEKQALETKFRQDRVSEDATFIRKNRNLMYPELKIKKKHEIGQKKENSSHRRVFLELDLQTWFYSKDGFIYNKCLNSLVLTAIRDRTVKLEWTPTDTSSRGAFFESLNGFAVQLRAKSTELSADQKWKFTPDGYIVLESDETCVLTDLSTAYFDDTGDLIVEGRRTDGDDLFAAFLACCPKCPMNWNFASLQRWGIRQESGFTIGDWRYSKVKNPQWHKLGLTWPVDDSGNLISELQWPLEGCFIPRVPPIGQLTISNGPAIFVPIRLQVLKNGERDLSKAIGVVGPDISNLILEPKASADMYRRLRIPEPEKEQRAHRQIQRMADARQREIKLFLENCTELCKLPFAARRLFDTRGIELFDLTSIPRDSYVYVTCGENWIDPALTKAEEQRRLLLANLSHDIRMMYFYCALRNPHEYVISAEMNLSENSRLILNRCALNKTQRERVRHGESIEHVIENEEPESLGATEPEPRTAHERSHKRVDERDREKFRWPWQRVANGSLNVDNEDDTHLGDSSILPAETPPSSHDGPRIPRTTLVRMQKFIWEGASGYITSEEDKNLVFGVKEVEGKVIDVILKRRNPDDIFQRWILIPVEKERQYDAEIDVSKPFLIVSKARPTMALTVLLPSFTDKDPSEMKVSCIGCPITLQQRRYEENGCANQKWSYDSHLGFSFAFNSTLTDKEITAANRANICSYTVHGEDLSQPGFKVSILNISDQVEDVPVCLACARAMRGKYRLVKIEADQRFSCAIGKRMDLKFQGPFHCLNHKVDLSRNEAENTLFEWQNQLEQLRQEASVRNIAKALAAAKPVQIVHLLVYRNGDGRIKPGEHITGSSIIGLLDQAAHRLDLNSAARRFYLSDGTVILTIEDFIQWAEQYYLKQYRQHLKSADGESKAVAHSDQQSEKTSLLSRMRSGNPSKERFHSVAKLSDIKRALKNDSQLDMSYLLKFPIEVWVSCGEPFVTPEAAEKRHQNLAIQYQQRMGADHDFEKEKHTLRQIKGRRISSQSPGELVAQSNPIEPVVKQGHWTKKTDAELDKQDDVKALGASLNEIRSAQQPEVTQPIVTPTLNRLTKHPVTKRVMVYPNGESKESAVACSGTTLAEIMNDAKVKLNLTQPVQALFDEKGQLIERFDQLTRDQCICAATNKVFISHAERQREIEIKANLSRTHRQFGEQSTDVRVSSSMTSGVHSVDPYGPPLLTHDDQDKLQQRLKTPARVAMTRRLPIESAPAPAGTISEVAPSPSVTKRSIDSNDDDGPNSEIARVTGAPQSKGVVRTETSSPDSPPAMPSGASARRPNPFSHLPTTQPAPDQNKGRPLAASKKSDSDDDDDEFMRMIKGKK